MKIQSSPSSVIAALLLGLTLQPLRAAEEDPAAQWIPLFNGKDLSGWTPKFKGHPAGENYANTFRVEDGVIRVVYDGYSQFEGTFGHLFYQTPYSNYLLRVEYRFVGDQVKGGPGWALRNSGIMIHGQAPESMDLGQDFPVSLEVQLLGGDGEHDRTTGNLCTPGTHVVMDGQLVTKHCISAKSKTYHGEQWVTAEVEAHGNGRIIHRINGETVIEYERPQLDPEDPTTQKLIKDGDVQLQGGTISLQSESHPVEFRKVEIRPLAE
jgi:hypothetical protein